jgi:hypothetical protein
MCSLQPCYDGGYVAAGKCNDDAIILKLDDQGLIEWQKTFGGSKSEWAYSAVQTTDDGFIAAGETDSFGPGWATGYLIKVDKDGNQQWQKAIGTQNPEFFESIQQTMDGGYIMAGVAVNGPENYYLVKTDSSGNVYYQ